MRETRRSGKKSHPRKCINDQVFFTKSCLRPIYCPGQAKLQKCVNYPLLHEGNLGKKYKNRSKGSKVVNQFRGVAKIRNL